MLQPSLVIKFLFRTLKAFEDHIKFWEYSNNVCLPHFSMPWGASPEAFSSIQPKNISFVAFQLNLYWVVREGGETSE